MRSAVVTGGAGFVGSHLVDALVEDGWYVTVLDDLSTGDSRRLPSEAYLIPLDVCDRERLDLILDATRPEAVFHLAAQPQVTLRDPVRGCRVDVEGTLNVLRAAERLGIPVVFRSTGAAVAIFIHRLARGETPVAFGHVRPTRDFVHIEDVVAALLAARGDAATFNVATGRATSAAAVLAILQELAPRPVPASWAPLRPGELLDSCLDPGAPGGSLASRPRPASRTGRAAATPR